MLQAVRNRLEMNKMWGSGNEYLRPPHWQCGMGLTWGKGK